MKKPKIKILTVRMREEGKPWRTLKKGKDFVTDGYVVDLVAIPNKNKEI